MYDYFDILGVSPDAGAGAVRFAERRRLRIPVPDFHQADVASDAGLLRPETQVLAVTGDLAVDFLDMSALVERMHRAFFANA